MFGLLFFFDVLIGMAALIGAIMTIPYLEQLVLLHLVAAGVLVLVFVGVLGVALGLRLRGRRGLATLLLGIPAGSLAVAGAVALVLMFAGGPHH